MASCIAAKLWWVHRLARSPCGEQFAALEPVQNQNKRSTSCSADDGSMVKIHLTQASVQAEQDPSTPTTSLYLVSTASREHVASRAGAGARIEECGTPKTVFTTNVTDADNKSRRSDRQRCEFFLELLTDISCGQKIHLLDCQFQHEHKLPHLSMNLRRRLFT